MAGVIDDSGQQWEHCSLCGKFVKVEELWYEVPNKRFRFGRDLCKRCAAPMKYTDRVRPPSAPIRIHIPH